MPPPVRVLPSMTAAVSIRPPPSSPVQSIGRGPGLMDVAAAAASGSAVAAAGPGPSRQAAGRSNPSQPRAVAVLVRTRAQKLRFLPISPVSVFDSGLPFVDTFRLRRRVSAISKYFCYNACHAALISGPTSHGQRSAPIQAFHNCPGRRGLQIGIRQPRTFWIWTMLVRS